MQSSYPIFASGQVLTSRHLNDLVEYLEPQDRMTRAKLIGIGVACGLDVSFEPQQQRVRVTAGCVVTSAGFLVVTDPLIADRARPYTVPIPNSEDGDSQSQQDARYPFFLDGDQQIQLWEMLSTTYEPRPGDTAPISLSSDFVSDKVVVLYLECNKQSLKNCDINDCSDKGAEMEFTPRVLLVSAADADAILALEADIQAVPVDRHNHSRYELSPLSVPKINPGDHGVDSFAELYGRISRIAETLSKQLFDSMNDAFNAYRYLLRDVYPDDQFPNGPFAAGYLAGVSNTVSSNPYLIQYLYDYLRDAVASHNEFLDAAARFDAECCPHEDRFPKHVLLGAVAERAVAFGPVVQTDGGGTADPLSANSGYGPSTRPAAYRHHFITAMVGGCNAERLARLRSLHYRTYLLAYRFQLDGLIKQPIQITPSKDGDVLLSDTAIPFHFAFRAGDDLHRNWSFEKTVNSRLEQVYSHRLIEFATHPLRDRMDEHNFYRIEGIVGKSLGKVMETLIGQKRKLGIPFAIEPVYMGLNIEGDPNSVDLDMESNKLASRALSKLFLCRMRELDVVFLILMSTLFYYLFAIISELARGNTRVIGGLQTPTHPPNKRPPVGKDFAVDVGKFTDFANFTTASIDRKLAESIMQDIRPVDYTKGYVTGRITIAGDAEQTVATFYQQIKDAPANNLYDRTVLYASKLDSKADAQQIAQRIYPTVSLLDKAEQLVETVSAPSLSDFDFQAFQQQYDGFVAAFDSFKTQAESGDDPPDSEVAQLHRSVLRNYDAVVATAPQSVVSNLLGEFKQRLTGLFDQSTMTEYAPRHPGMVHKAGVPAGGTLILLYTHFDLLQQTMKANREAVETKFLDGKAASANLNRPSADATAFTTAARDTGGGEPLDQFVVLADFCVPYLCCDSDCSEIQFEPSDNQPPRTEPAVTRPPISRPPTTDPPRTDPPVVDPPPIPRPPVVDPPITGPPITRPPVVDPPIAEPDETRPPVVDPRREDVTIRGTVLGAPIRPGARMRPLTSATLRVVNVETKDVVNAKIENGDFEFTAPPGTYRIQSEASSTFEPMDGVVEIKPDTPKKQDFILERN